MNPYIKTEAVILKTWKIHNADRLLLLFTPEYGKKKGVIRAIRKGRNKYRGNTEIGNIVKLMFYSKEEQKEIVKIIDIETMEPFFPIRQNWHKLLTLNYLLNLIDEAFPLHDKHKNVYTFFTQTLMKLQNDDEKKIPLLLRTAELKILHELGIGRHFALCSQCGRTIHDDFFFHPDHLSVLCSSCHKYKQSGEISLSSDFLKFYNDIIQSRLPAEYNSAIDSQAKLFFKYTFSHYIGREITSLKILESLPW